MAEKRVLKRTTKASIMAAQEQAIRTNNIKAKIDKTQENSKCRMCGKAEESANHVLSECNKLAQKECKRQGWFGTKIHWEICKKYGIEVKKWYQHTPEVNRKDTGMEPWWKRRMEAQVKQLNKDHGHINTLIERKNIRKKHKDELERRSYQ